MIIQLLGTHGRSPQRGFGLIYLGTAGIVPLHFPVRRLDGESPLEEPGGLSWSGGMGAQRDGVRASGGRSGDADRRPGAAAHSYSLGHPAAVLFSTQQSLLSLFLSCHGTSSTAGVLSWA